MRPVIWGLPVADWRSPSRAHPAASRSALVEGQRTPADITSASRFSEDAPPPAVAEHGRAIR